MLLRTVRGVVGRRQFSTLPIQISEEVKQALNDKIPVVSLESTIITHGLPFPENIKMAREVESMIRDQGCVPATMAFIKGIPKVGLSDSDLDILASAKDVHKTSRRDIGVVMADKLIGGTTISSTMILSKLAGIKVFATGGLGGVHKNGESTMDISADLDELSKTEVMVVCSGPKLILDIERTTEYLETKGVPILTYNPKRKSKVYIPGFYCEESNTLSPFQFTDFAQPASVFHHGSQMLLGNGYLVCIPPPDHLALEKEFIYRAIDEAQLEAEALGVKGKDVTPFLLGKINADTGGQSVKSNVGFVLNNARCALEIAKNLGKLENGGTIGKSSFQPSTKLDQFKREIKTPTQQEQCDSVVVGSIAVDLTCVLRPGYKINDSNPGDSKQTVGGVGYNVALASTFASKNVEKHPNELRLISIVGTDSAAEKVKKELSSKEMDTTGLLQTSDFNTAQYISVHGDDGSLIVACADMDIVEKLPKEHVLQQLRRASPQNVIIDSNLSVEIMDTVLSQSLELGFQVALEPTSVIKAGRIAQAKSLKTWPQNQVQFATPTVEELSTMYDAFEAHLKFDDLDNWFNILDKLGLDSTFRNELDSKANKNATMKRLLQKGTLQQAFKLLPYIPCLVIKDGANGILVVQLVVNAHEAASFPQNADFSLVSRGGKQFYGEANEPHKLGVYIEHYKPSVQLADDEIKNVTGAGDSLMGYLFTKMANGTLFLDPLDAKRHQVFQNCQLLAGTSLRSENAINVEKILDIE